MKLQRIKVQMPKVPTKLLDVKHFKSPVTLQKGPSNRRYTKEKAYISYRKSHHASGCDFCQFETNQAGDIVMATKHFLIVKNMFQYDIWDGCPVTEHLLVSPRRHVVSLNDFTDEEKLAYIQLISEWESKGYSIYARSDLDKTKSVPHQHTHLIRLQGRPVKAMVYLHAPHMLLYR